MTSGGMTRGRGITESTLARWVHPLPQCVPICEALESFASVHSGTSVQRVSQRTYLITIALFSGQRTTLH